MCISHILCATFLGLHSGALSATKPATTTTAKCTPLGLYCWCKLFMRLNCAALQSDKENRGGTGSAYSAPLVTKKVGFEVDELLVEVVKC